MIPLLADILPDPNSYQSMGWVLAVLFALGGGLLILKQLTTRTPTLNEGVSCAVSDGVKVLVLVIPQPSPLGIPTPTPTAVLVGRPWLPEVMLASVILATPAWEMLNE